MFVSFGNFMGSLIGDKEKFVAHLAGVFLARAGLLFHKFKRADLFHGFLEAHVIVLLLESFSFLNAPQTFFPDTFLLLQSFLFGNAKLFLLEPGNSGVSFFDCLQEFLERVILAILCVNGKQRW